MSKFNPRNINWVAEMLGLRPVDVKPGTNAFGIASQLADDFTTAHDPDQTDEFGRQMHQPDTDGHEIV